MPKIEQLFAYVVADTGPDDEGVPSFAHGNMHYPMVGADMDRARSLRSHAQVVADARGKPVKLVRSTGLEVVEVVHPQERPLVGILA